jgi:hypothetical protein
VGYCTADAGRTRTEFTDTRANSAKATVIERVMSDLQRKSDLRNADASEKCIPVRRQAESPTVGLADYEA